MTIAETSIDLAIIDMIEDDADWLDYLTAEAREVVKAGGDFHIEDDATADWYLKVLGRYEGELQVLNAQYMQRVERLAKQKAAFEARFGAEFNTFVLDAINRPGFKGKTLHLAYGSAFVTSYQRKPKVADAVAALAFAKQSVPKAITIVPAVEKLSISAYKAAAQQALNDTGEILPGIEITPAGDVVTVKLPGVGK